MYKYTFEEQYKLLSEKDKTYLNQFGNTLEDQIKEIRSVLVLDYEYTKTKLFTIKQLIDSLQLEQSKENISGS